MDYKGEIRLAIINFCAVTNKQPELASFLYLRDIDVLCGTESHLDDTFSNSEIFPQNFNVYRNDRNSHGGGVFIIVKDTLPSSQVDTGASCEIVWCCIHGRSGQTLIVGSFYCPPQSSIAVLEELTKSIRIIKAKYPSARLILGGDFNAPGIDWKNGCLTESYTSKSFRELLITISSDYFLEQVVSEPTRGRNLLDLCFTTHPNQVKQCSTMPGLSDHEAVIVTFATSLHVLKQCPRKTLLYNKANWDSIKESVIRLFEDYLLLNDQQTRSVEENWQYIKHHLSQLIDQFIPVKVTSRKVHLPWLTAAIKRLINKKQRIYRRAKRYQLPQDWQLFKEIQHEVKSRLRKQHWQYVNNIISSDNDTTKDKLFWRYIKGRRQDRVGIGTLKVSHHEITEPSV